MNARPVKAMHATRGAPSSRKVLAIMATDAREIEMRVSLSGKDNVETVEEDMLVFRTTIMAVDLYLVSGD